MRTHLSLLLALLLPPGVAGQGSPTTPFAVDRFGLDEGLPGMAVTDLEIGSDGRLWVLASGRLTSFDGRVFEQHDIPEATSSRHGRVVAIGAGSADTLWLGIGTRLFHLHGGELSEVGSHRDILRDVWQEPDGQLWAWDDHGAVRWIDGSFVPAAAVRYGWNRGSVDPEGAPGAQPGRVPVSYVDPRGGLPRRLVDWWIEDPEEFPGLWPGARGRGDLLVVRDEGDSLHVAAAGSNYRLADLPGRRVLLVDQRQLLWTAYRGAVEAWDAEGHLSARADLPPTAGPLTAAREDRHGNLWIGTRDGGLLRVRPLPFRVLTASEGLSDGQIAEATDGGGNRALVRELDGHLYRTDGLEVDTVFRAGQGDPIGASVTDRRGTVWVAAHEGRSVFLNGLLADGRSVRVEIPFQRVSRIREDPDVDGLLWLAGRDLFRVRGYEPSGPAMEAPLLEGVRAGDMLIAADGAVWLSNALGVTRWSQEGIQTFLSVDGYPTGNARGMHQDAEGNLWIGRYFGGIVRYRDGRFEEVRAEDGLWEDVVSAILEDDSGNLWLSGNRGIHRVPRQALIDFLDRRIRRVPGRGYGGNEGLLNPEGSGGAAHRTSDGRLWFPTFEGIALLDPARVLAREAEPPGIRLFGVRTEDRQVLAGASVELPKGARRIEFAFAAIDLRHAGEHRYEAILEGVDSDWVDVGTEGSASYANVPAGRHTFRVRAVSATGSRSPATEMVVGIPPFFHETLAFYSLLTLALGMGLWGAHRLRSQRLRARAQELEGLVASRTAELDYARMRAEDALATVGRQAEELRLLSAAKSRFFANVSHELRTPLTLMNGPLAEVLDDRFGRPPAPMREQLSIVLASGRRLGELVEQLLDVARLDSGKFELHREWVDLRPLFDRLGRSFKALGEARGRRVEVRLPQGSILAKVDADQIEKVVANLLSNAVKFTGIEGTVRFSVVEAEGPSGPLLRIQVEDDGIGVPLEDRERIFQRFERGDAATGAPGAGLGLALVREVAELHGGRVELHSEVGRGSRFVVHLPVAESGESPDEGEVHDDRPNPTTPLLRWPFEAPSAGMATGHPRKEEGAQEEVPTHNLEALWSRDPGLEDDRPTVLVVEDNDDLRAYIRRQLEPAYHIVEAGDGVQGLEMARRVVPDLALCDVMMPGIDGVELCRIIRGDPDVSFIPIVMLTAKAARESRISGLEAGADDYLVKPFDPEELLLRVDNILGARKRYAEHLRADRGPLRGWSPRRTAGGSKLVLQLSKLLRERAGDEDFGTKEMARALAMSRSTLYRKIAEVFDSSPAEVLWGYRLEQAAQWLGDGEARVSDVAYGCGFRTVPHFIRRFKERFGVTPAAWRADTDPTDRFP